MLESLQEVVCNCEVDLSPIVDVLKPLLEQSIRLQDKIIYNQQYQINLIFVILVLLVFAYIINFFYKLLNKF